MQISRIRFSHIEHVNYSKFLRLDEFLRFQNENSMNPVHTSKNQLVLLNYEVSAPHAQIAVVVSAISNKLL